MNCLGRARRGRPNGGFTFLDTPEMGNNRNLSSDIGISFAMGEKVSNLEPCLQTNRS